VIHKKSTIRALVVTLTVLLFADVVVTFSVISSITSMYQLVMIDNKQKYNGPVFFSNRSRPVKT